MNEQEWTIEIARLKRRVSTHPKRENLVVFYGSSSIRLWENLSRDLRPLNVLNLGFGGSSLYWCNYYFEELFVDLTPAHLVVYAGENDLSEGKTPKQVLGDLEDLISKAKRHFKGIKITVISLKPSPSRMGLIEEIRKTNDLFASAIDGTENADMIWIHELMLRHGDANPELFSEDLLHMNEKGYEIWRDALRSHIL